MKLFFRFVGEATAQSLVFLFFFVMFGSMSTLVRNAISTASETHWLAGAVLGFTWVLVISVFFFLIWYALRPSAPKWVRTFFLIRKNTGQNAGLIEQFPIATTMAVIISAMLTSVFALSAASTILESQKILTYTVESQYRDLPMSELLFRLYVWHAIDMIPVVDIWKVYDLKPPVRALDPFAQSIILMFRTAVVGFAVALIAQSVRFNHKNQKPTSSEGTSG